MAQGPLEIKIPTDPISDAHEGKTRSMPLNIKIHTFASINMNAWGKFCGWLTTNTQNLHNKIFIA